MKGNLQEIGKECELYTDSPPSSNKLKETVVMVFLTIVWGEISWEDLQTTIPKLLEPLSVRTNTTTTTTTATTTTTTTTTTAQSLSRIRYSSPCFFFSHSFQSANVPEAMWGMVRMHARTPSSRETSSIFWHILAKTAKGQGSKRHLHELHIEQAIMHTQNVLDRMCASFACQRRHTVELPVFNLKLHWLSPNCHACSRHLEQILGESCTSSRK